MNLVAKQYLSSRTDDGGVLILSSFTGAATELTDAVIVNPYDTEETAMAIYVGLTMSKTGKRERMLRMRGQIATNNNFWWAGQLLGEIHRISELSLAPARLHAG